MMAIKHGKLLAEVIILSREEVVLALSHVE